MYDFVYRKSAPPPELIVALDWLRFGTPYRAGGLENQPMRFFHRLKIAANCHALITAWKNYGDNPKWLEMNRETVKTMEYIWTIVGELENPNE